MQKRLAGLFIIVVAVLLAAGCAMKKRHVGKRVNYNSPVWCECDSLPQTCIIYTEAFTFQFTVRKGKVEGEYVIKGTAEGLRGAVKSFTHLVDSDTRFSFIIANEGIVVDNIAFLPMGSDLRQKLPFKKTFKIEEFDALTVTYNISVRG